MSDLDKSITRIIETYKSAVHAKDAAAFMRLYDPKVRIFDTWGVWSYEGGVMADGGRSLVHVAGG